VETIDKPGTPTRSVRSPMIPARLLAAGCVVVAAMAAAAFAPAPAQAAEKRCRSVTADVAKATSVRRTTGWRCKHARRAIRNYFEKVGDSAQTEGGCAQVRNTSSCKVGRYRCRTRYSPTTNRLTGKCVRGQRIVRFVETDFGPS
jgi:hypothetical protein